MAKHRRLAKVIGVVVAALVVIVGLSYLIGSRSLAHYLQGKMNHALKGYTVHIDRAYFHPHTLGLDLTGVTLSQNAYPSPPVASFAGLYLRVNWRAVLRGHLVGNFTIDRPKLYINLKNIKAEEKSKVPVAKKGWQDAVQAIYPLKINVLSVSDGDLTYVDVGPYKPLHLSHINLTAYDIRNVIYPKGVYPSPIHLDARIFEKGRVVLDGRANFLLEPHAGVKADASIEDMDLGYFRPITSRQNLDLRKGTLSAKGSIEYAPNVTAASLRQVELKGVDADYVHLAKTAEAEKKRAEEVGKEAKKVQKSTTAKVNVDIMNITGSTFGFVNKASSPNYRVFLTDLSATVKNFSNQFVSGPATMEMKGRFMGTGDTKATGTFRSEKAGAPDFNVNVSIDNTQMPAMNDLFRAYGKFDIQKGLFSLYSQLTVRNNRIDGYVKPMFKDLKVVDMRTRKEKGIFHKIYVGIVKGLSKLMKNPSTKQVATEARISGPVGGTRLSTLQAIGNIIRNAFFQAILPGFERQLAGKKE